MGWFGKSFEEKVDEAIGQLRAKNLVKNLSAQVEGKVVTLLGQVPTKEIRNQIRELFDKLVETENTLVKITVDEPRPAPAAPAAPVEAPVAAEAMPAEAGPAGETGPAGERIHEVVSGDTLGGISRKYYGKASQYMKIFEANRDQLDNPDLIKVGQKLRIPE